MTARHNSKIIVGLLNAALYVALPSMALALPGDLDRSFGSGGSVITRGANVNNLDIAMAMAVQADGKIVVVGRGWTRYEDGWDFAVVRYNANGSLDTSFGGTGIVISQLGNSNDYA